MWYTHVNRNTINSNTKNGTSLPAVRIQEGKNGKPVYGFEVELPAGSRMIYSPHEPLLKCGARLVIESETAPTIIR